MWVYLLFIGCFDSTEPEGSRKPLPVKKEQDKEIRVQNPLVVSSDSWLEEASLRKTAVLVKEMAAMLKNQPDNKVLEKSLSFQNMVMHRGLVCGLLLDAIEETVDLKGQRQEQRRKKLEKIARTKSSGKKLNPAQREPLQQRAQKSFEELEATINDADKTAESADDPPLAIFRIVEQKIPESVGPCVQQTEKLLSNRLHMNVESHSFFVRSHFKEASYKCVGGEFTEKIETIEVLGKQASQTDVFAEARKQCVITEQDLDSYSVHIEEKQP